MDAISSTAPAPTGRTVRLRVVGAALAVTAIGTLGAGYALGTSEQPAPTVRPYVGSQPTWSDAARESTALKQRAYSNAVERVDIRYERVR